MTGAIYPDLVDGGVLVTGGATGIGADIVRAFAGQGARVAFLDIQDDPATELIAELSTARHTPIYQRCDLTDLAAMPQVVAVAARALGSLNVLVNNAADDTRHKVEDVTPEMWDHTIAINLRAQFFVAQAVLPLLKDAGGGAIINLSSISWRYGPDMIPVYGAAKAGVLGLTHSLARALGPDNIRVNAIEPGAVMTDRQRRLWYPTAESVAAMIERQILRQPLLGADIANMAVFLASDQTRLITKQSFIVDAGLS